MENDIFLHETCYTDLASIVNCTYTQGVVDHHILDILQLGLSTVYDYLPYQETF